MIVAAVAWRRAADFDHERRVVLEREIAGVENSWTIAWRQQSAEAGCTLNRADSGKVPAVRNAD